MSEEIAAALTLAHHVRGLGPVGCKVLLDGLGSACAVFSSPVERLLEFGLPERLARSLSGVPPADAAWRTMEEAVRLGVRIVPYTDPRYPPALRAIPDPPPVLYAKGTLLPEERPAVAVVGCRNPTLAGGEIAKRFGAGLAAAGVTVVSGMAMGIDGCAHLGALSVSGRTVAVLASGVDLPTPRYHERLYGEIIDGGGLVLSEFPLGSKPTPERFPARNRVISGLSLGVVVVEAGRRSGALITVEHALSQGREVFSVPGSVLSPQSEGTNLLIKEGATPVTEPADVLLALGIEAQAAGPPSRVERPDLSGEERTLLGVLDGEPRHLDEVARACGLAPAAAAVHLLSLEMKGLVRQFPGKLFSRA